MLSISTFGGLHITLQGEPLTGFVSQKASALLVYLAVEAERPHNRSALAGLLWPEQPEQVARKNLRDLVLNLQKTLGNQSARPPFLKITRNTLQFNCASDHSLDVSAFSARVAVVETHRHRQLETCRGCSHALQQAVDLYRGDFLCGVYINDSAAFENWLVLLRERLRQQALMALHHLARYHARRGEFSLARDYARRQVELAPWLEEAHRQLMGLLALDGQRSAALRQYEACRRQLADELGVEPAPETMALYEQIKAGNPDEWQDPGQGLAACLPIPAIPPHNLPIQLTPFFGRAREMDQISERLQNPDCRLLTLTGPGGIGKTRLAVQIGFEGRFDYTHGVYFVPLAGLTNHTLLDSTLAQALHLNGRQPPHTQLENFLRDKTILLILDNFEQLREGASFLVQLLQTAPYLQILVTSRTRLDLRGEWVFPVTGVLETDAIALFTQTANRKIPSFAPRGKDLQTIGRLTRLVGGMPLALEIAASWLQVFTPDEIVSEMEKSLEFLSTRQQGIPERHRSLRDIFAQTWMQLSSEAQRALARLSVFRGAFSYRAAVFVAETAPSVLQTLIDHSFLHQHSAQQVSMHEVIRQFACKKLAENAALHEATQEKHSRYFLMLLSRNAERFHGPEQRTALEAIIRDIDNIRVAWKWGVARKNVNWLVEAAPGLNDFYQFMHWEDESLEVFSQARTQLDLEYFKGEERQSARILQGELAAYQGESIARHHRLEDARALLLESLAIAQKVGDQKAVGYRLRSLGDIEMQLGNFETAQQLLADAVQIAREQNETRLLALALFTSGLVGTNVGDLTMAGSFYEEALAIQQSRGDKYGEYHVLTRVGLTHYYKADYEKSCRAFLQAFQIARELDIPYLLMTSYGYLGLNEYVRRNYQECIDLASKQVEIASDLGDLHALANGHTYIGISYFKMGHSEKAIQHHLQALENYRATHHKYNITLAYTNLGEAYLLDGQSNRARECYQEGLTQSIEIQAKPLIYSFILGFAHLAFEGEEYYQSARLAALVRYAPEQDSENSTEADSLLDKLQEEIPLSEFEEAIEQGKGEAQRPEVLAELAVELSRNSADCCFKLDASC